MWFTGPVRNFGMRRTCSCQHPGCQHVGTNYTPLGRDQRGDPSETSQALTCLLPTLDSQHAGGNLHPLGRSGRGGTVETSQALTCHPAVVIYCQPCHEAVICLSLPTNPGQSACGGNLHPLGRSGRGVHAEMLQALGCHLAVMVCRIVTRRF